MVLVRLIEAFDGDAHVGFSQVRYRKAANYSSVHRVGESSALMMAAACPGTNVELVESS